MILIYIPPNSWFSEDMNCVSVVDMTAAIKNCKVLIALVSDEFERDSKCRDLFLYAKETMNKEIIIIVLGESMEWENKDLGMKIGKQEVCCFKSKVFVSPEKPTYRDYCRRRWRRRQWRRPDFLVRSITLSL